jgi:hypothetical protein
VSLSWRDQVRIALCPDRVILTRLHGRWRPRVTAKQIVHCAQPGAPDALACIDALRAALLDDERWHNADAVAIVSNHFVRYALVPWSGELLTEDEKRAWVAHHFVNVYGEAMTNSEYRWCDTHPDAPCLASAVDADLIARLSRVFESTSVQLKSVQPYFMAVFNRWQRHVNGKSTWMLAHEHGRICLAGTARGRWQSFVSRAIGADWSTELAVILRRERMLAETAAAPSTMLAYVPEIPDFQIAGWDAGSLRALLPRALSGFSPVSEAAYAMALTGVA